MTAEIAAAAARMVVEEGLEYAQAKRRAAEALAGRATRGMPWPSNDDVEAEVRSYLQLFRADSQPGELAALRELALKWMQTLTVHRPHVSGAVWRGTATRLNDIWIDLFCDDPKAAEIDLLNQHHRYDVSVVPGWRGDWVDVLTLSDQCEALGARRVLIHLRVHDHDDLRGALRPPARKASGDRGTAQALRQRMREARQAGSHDLSAGGDPGVPCA